jgi:hypothetical protein
MIRTRRLFPAFLAPPVRDSGLGRTFRRRSRCLRILLPQTSGVTLQFKACEELGIVGSKPVVVNCRQ